ncbi:DUF4231 domain-containing protein [Dactylosporangium sp. NPDC050688]|uniref:DUF4231 domain-containing protein n=1 Tax=Dactylosporangium sp. NPDC050688 TaxID=3157217 RepID=UPI0033DF59BF
MDQGSGGECSREYAINVANESFEWYRLHAIRSRKWHKFTEVSVVLIAAAIPASVVVFPDGPVLSALLGTAVVVLTGLKSTFHWQENYLRYSEAREAVETERRRYHTLTVPYDSDQRDQILIQKITAIEHDEMRGWLRVARQEKRQPDSGSPA